MIKIKNFIKRIFFFIVCACVLISAPIFALNLNKSASAEGEKEVITLWQIDSFEGGKGSRATYLQNIANKFSKNENCIITVISLNANAARLNICDGKVPDLISYGAGFYGIENLIDGYKTWCNGGYCLLTLGENADFSDVSKDNTIINAGIDNFVQAATLFCGLNGATVDKPTGAYVKLISGKFKYLLGTQRDIMRLKTREEVFSVKPITIFNDLYQNISLICKSAKKKKIANEFIDYLIDNKDNLSKIGLFSGSSKLYSDEMSIMENITYEYKLISPISESIKNEISSALINCDENKLKKDRKSVV